MSQRIVIECDECKSIRTESNHWWSIVDSETFPTFMSFKDAETHSTSFRIDFCGRQCINSAFQRWLETGLVVKKTIGETSAQ